MSGFQPNGLPSNVKGFDTITSHDWSDTSAWPATDNSVWTLQPGADEVYKVTGVLIKFTEDMIIHSGGGMIIKGHIDGWASSPITLAQYSSMADFMARADEMNRIAYSGPINGDVNKPIIQLKFDFSKPVIIWSSAGVTGGNPHVDILGNPKWEYMTAEIADDLPYKDDNSDPAQMARSRYFVEIYEDPDV
jgi:hypothetical protein